jgi:hypothetical protein
VVEVLMVLSPPFLLVPAIDRTVPLTAGLR